jgi:PTS hybrid protein
VAEDGTAADPSGAGRPPAAVPVTGSATLVNPSGLHARPAAEFVRLASTFDATITVNGVDAKSLLRIMSLGLGIGTSVSVEATGPEADKAVAELTALLASGFGE